MKLIYLIIFICQYIYLNYFFKKRNPNIIKSEYKYILEDSNKTHSATIYRTHRNVKKIILFFSGGYSFGYHYYINKIMYDLDNEYKERMSKYELICYEKRDKTSFDAYNDIYYYISNLDKDVGKIEELIFIGCSAGGIAASHVMEKCKNMSCKKKIINYDTPLKIYEIIKSFKNNWIFRFDLFFFKKVCNIYSKHYNNDDIKNFFKINSWNYDSNELIKLIKNIHNWNDENFNKMTEFNFNQTKDTKVYNIYSRKDIFIVNDINDKFIEKNKDKINFFYKNIEKNTIGHCTDIAFSTDYLVDIIISISN